MISVIVPELGDGAEVEVIELCVAPGDRVAAEDPLIVIESDKASLEVPAPAAGIVKALHVALGDRCKEGDLIVELEAEGAPAEAASATPVPAEAPAPEPPAPQATPEAVAAPKAAPADAAPVDVTVPEVGDAAEVVVVDLMVAVGEEVEADQGLVALESDKATMEVPAPVAGRVLELCLAVGDAVTDGTLVARLAPTGGAPAAVSAPPSAAAPEGAQPEPAEASRASSAPVSAPAPAPAAPKAAAAASAQGPAAGDGAAVYAGPAVRRLARELGVTLAGVKGTGSRGRVTKEDLKAHVKTQMTTPKAEGGAIPPIPPVDFERFGSVRLEPISRMMRAGAANLHRSWLNIPHVTQHDEADITALEAFRKSLKDDPAAGGVKVTPLAFILKAVASALRAFPRVGGSFHADGENYVLKDYVHIGIAVDTEEGLIVPVLRDVDQKGVLALSEEIAAVSARARARTLKPDELRGGCFSVSSLGAIGGTGFTPIINPPEVAILGVAKLRKGPVWNGEAFEPRDLLPLSLSYDHRAINGAEAGRFMTHFCHLLGDVRRLML